MVKAARDLYGADSTDATATVAAWKAVKVTAGPLTCAAVPAPGANFANPGFEQGNNGAWTAVPGSDHRTLRRLAARRHVRTRSSTATAPPTPTRSRQIGRRPRRPTSATLTFCARRHHRGHREAPSTSSRSTVEDDAGCTRPGDVLQPGRLRGDYAMKSLDLTPYVGKTVDRARHRGRGQLTRHGVPARRLQPGHELTDEGLLPVISRAAGSRRARWRASAPRRRRRCRTGRRRWPRR